MRIAIGFNNELPVSQTVSSALLAEELGYDSFWLHEHSFGRDAISYLTAAAEATTKIKLGVACLSPYTRHPVVLAMSMLTLQESSHGRAMLGIGTGFPMRLDLMGLRHDKPIAALKETIEICRGLWTGNVLNYQGKVFSLKNVKPITGKAHSQIPIYIAGWKRQMLALTGKYADGYVAKGGESTQSIRQIVSRLHSAAAKSGRSSGSIDVSAYLLTYAAQTDKEALNTVRKDPWVTYMLSVQDDYLYEGTGIDPAKKKPIAENYFKGNVAEASSHITDDMLEAFTLTGTPDHVCDRILAFQKAGLNLPILQPISMKNDDVKAVLLAGSMLIGSSREETVATSQA